MNKNTAKDYLPLVQALADGKTIQLQSGNSWLDIEETKFNYDPSEYRIKPEPREKWFNRYENGVENGPYSTLQNALFAANSGATQVRYREVIE